MNRRLFLFASLPALWGAAAARAAAPPKPAPKRIRIEVSRQKTPAVPGETTAQTIVLSAVEGIPAEAALTETFLFRDAPGGPALQTYGPRLSVTAQIEADGRIRLSCSVAFADMEAAAGRTSPGRARPRRCR